MNCDPNELSKLSSCFRCIAGELELVKTYLLCQWLNKQGPLIDSAVTAWSSRVVTNGGAPVSKATQLAVSAFVTGMKADGIWTKMLALNVFVPDSLIACLTPLIVGTGSDPWVNHGFVAGNLSTSGLQWLNGSNNYLDTGCNLATIFPLVTDCGFTWAASSTQIMAMRANAFDTVNMGGLYSDGTNAYTGLFSAWEAQPPLITGVPSKLFCSASRLAATATLIQKNTVNGSGSTSGAAGSARPNLVLYVYCWNTNNVAGTFSATLDITATLMAIHTNLTATDTNNFYARFQTLRNALGGGAV